MIKDKKENEDFKIFASDWWDKQGSMKELHAMSPTRMTFIKERISNHYKYDLNNKKLLSKKNILDIGCGGGIASEALANMGGIVTGIDISNDLINVAKNHAKANSLNINYKVSDIEVIKKSGKKYDIVTVLEVLEHINHLDEFLLSLLSVVKNDGIVVFSTINRNLLSYFAAIFLAEYIFKLVPKRTHTWSKFLKPSEILEVCVKKGFFLDKVVGLSPVPLLGKIDWIRTSNIKVNYIMSLIKK